MRVITGLVSLLLLACPGMATAQSFELHGSAGPTLIDTGYSLAAGIGFSPASHVTVALDVERTHLSSQLRTDGRGGVVGSRGGTFTLIAPQLHMALFGRNRVGPKGLSGFAAGVSRPNVNDLFPGRTNPRRCDVALLKSITHTPPD